jgi:hypothetical protein
MTEFKFKTENSKLVHIKAVTYFWSQKKFRNRYSESTEE